MMINFNKYEQVKLISYKILIFDQGWWNFGLN